MIVINCHKAWKTSVVLFTGAAIPEDGLMKTTSIGPECVY